MAIAVDSTLRDELAQAADVLRTASAEQVARGEHVLALLDTNARYADALRDLATALPVDSYARLRRETLATLDEVTHPPAPPGQPSTPH